MRTFNVAIAIAVVATISCCIQISEAASIIPLNNEKIMRQLVSYAAEVPETVEDHPDSAVVEKRYSHSMYTSERGRGNDRAAVRRLLDMLVGKRADVTGSEQKRSGIVATDPSSAFENVHGYLLLVGKVTDDIMDQVVQDAESALDEAGTE